MKAYNLADLENSLTSSGWQVDAQNFVAQQGVPGQVQDCFYRVALTNPTGRVFSGEGSTRSDALRVAADNAALLEPDQPNLI